LVLDSGVAEPYGTRIGVKLRVDLYTIEIIVQGGNLSVSE
jgi:hypothetical protein